MLKYFFFSVILVISTLFLVYCHYNEGPTTELGVCIAVVILLTAVRRKLKEKREENNLLPITVITPSQQSDNQQLHTNIIISADNQRNEKIYLFFWSGMIISGRVGTLEYMFYKQFLSLVE